MRWFAVALALSATFFGASFGRGEESASPDPAMHLLRYKFKQGDTVRSQVVHQSTVETTVQGMSQTTEAVSRSVKVWRVTNVESDGKITFEHLVESVDMRQKMSGRDEVRYNSITDKQAPPGYQDVAAAVGVPLMSVTIDRSGKLLDKVQKHGKPSADYTGNQMVIALPEEAVSVGHVWTVPQEVPVPLDDGGVKNVQTRIRYELTKVQNAVATIEVETQIITPINDPKIQAQLIQRQSRGTVKFDIDASRVLSQQMDLDERVIGFSGADSSLHYLTRFTEEWLPSDAKAAAAKPQSARKLRR